MRPIMRNTLLKPLITAALLVSSLSLRQTTANANICPTIEGCPGAPTDPPKCPQCPCPPPNPSPSPSGSSGSSGCTSCGDAVGMATWWVSEPRINLRVEDEIISYTPGRGLPTSFGISYRQRESVLEFPT